jgi:stage V sporulation protein R
MYRRPYRPVTLPLEIAQQAETIAGHARREGLDFFETIFELLDYDQITQVASYGGFPQRYPHWRFGMEYERMRKQSTYGLSKIYEMVINNDPCYAYLLSDNAMVDHKLVIAHVYAHCDFFKNNTWFSKTNRKMMDEMANHATRIRRYVDRHGYETVERFIDTCLSLEELIDPYSVFMRREPAPGRPVRSNAPPEIEASEAPRAKSYMEKYMRRPRSDARPDPEQASRATTREVIPTAPHRDLLLLLMQHAPLADWQTDVLSIVREEAYYFAPQAQTKIMNEGWASYWHSTLMTRYILGDDELITYCDHHSGTVATQPGRLNPYKVGIELFRDIEQRWNTGRYGPDYDGCTDMEVKRNWGRDSGVPERVVGLDSPGRQKIYEVRRVHNDVTFIDEFLTPEFVDRHKLYHYRQDPSTGRMVVVNRDFNRIKQQMLYMLSNHCRPYIYALDANYANRGELFLAHKHNGLDMEIKYITETLRNVYNIWSRPVHMQAHIDDEMILFSFDGAQSSQQRMSDKELPEPAHAL